MRKIAIFFAIVIAIVAQISYILITNQNKETAIKKENKIYEAYLNKETNGLGIATIINKAMDSNYKNEVEKNQKGKYQENDTNSINIDIKMLDNDTTYNMETIFDGKIDTFVSYYRDINFKCTKIEYHDKTGRVKYMLFEQITQ